MLYGGKSYSWQEVVLPDLRGLFPNLIHLIESRFVNCEEMFLEIIPPAERDQKKIK